MAATDKQTVTTETTKQAAVVTPVVTPGETVTTETTETTETDDATKLVLQPAVISDPGAQPAPATPTA